MSAWASRQRAANEGQRSRALVAAVGLWITAAIPVVSAGLLSDADPGQDWTTLGAAAALALVALGLFIFLPTTWASSTHETLTDLRAEQIDQRSLLIAVVAMVFLPLTFLTGLLGMNVDGIPYAHKPWAFDAVVTLCVAMAVLIAGFFVRRHWFES